MDSIFKLLCECPHVFQDQSGCATYFIEFPLLSMEALREVAQKKGLSFKLAYKTLGEIMDTENDEVCPKLRECFNNQKLQAYTKRYIEEAQPIEITDRYAIISCEPKVDTYMMHVIHYCIHKKHGEEWRFYRAFRGEIPTDEEIKSFKGVIIPGSSASAYLDLEWYGRLFECIRKIVLENKQINVLAICFGAQVISQALGGRVEKMNRPFIRGEDVLIVQPSLYEHGFVRNSRINSSTQLLIAESHGDHIVKLAPNAVCQASSINTNVECYTIGTNVLAFQGHPEYNEAWTAGAAFREKKMQIDDYDRYADEYMKEKFPIAIPRENLLRMCYTFLKKDAEGIVI